MQRYVHGDGEDVPLAAFAGSQVTSPDYLFTNHQGSVVALADANGALTAIDRYDEYGIPAATNQGRFQYTGQAWLPDIGMYHYKAQVYSPTLGRFLQTDPIGYDDQVNLYAYVANDPVNMHDPEGESARAVVSGANWAWKIYRFSGNVGRATKETLKELSTDWHALDSDAKTSAWDKVKASADLIIGTNLYNEGNSGQGEKAKDRRARQQAEQRDARASRQGGGSDNQGQTPGNNQAQNRQFDSVAKELKLNQEQADQLHREVSKQGMRREDLLKRARDLFQ